VTLTRRLALRLGGVAAALGALALLPLWVSNPYVLSVLTLAALYAIFASSWDILSGYIGQLNFGHAVFFGVGAYTAGFLGPHLPPLLVLPAVYARVTDAEGDYDLQLELVRLEDERTVGWMGGRVEIEDRMVSRGVVFNLDEGLVFERPGRYEFRLFADNRHVGGTVLTVIQGA